MEEKDEFMEDPLLADDMDDIGDSVVGSTPATVNVPQMAEVFSTVTPIEDVSISGEAGGNLKVKNQLEIMIQQSYGQKKELTTITYDWIPKQQGVNKITKEHARQQLAILGKSEPSEQEVNDTISDMIRLMTTVANVGRHHVVAIIIGQAQAQKITLYGRSITQFRDIARWWATLTEEKAVENAAIMFNIQQLMFESGTWSKDLESQIMQVAKLQYHRPPKLPVNTKGCICSLLNVQRTNQAKNLTKGGKKTHKLFISVKPREGISMSRHRRSDMGLFKPWMLQRYKGKEKGRSTGNNCSTVSPVDGFSTFCLNKALELTIF
jgi:hypothetical protein